jgi:hypothetical protein
MTNIIIGTVMLADLINLFFHVIPNTYYNVLSSIFFSFFKYVSSCKFEIGRKLNRKKDNVSVVSFDLI